MATYTGHFEDSSGNILLPTPSSYTSVIETSMTASQAYAIGDTVQLNIPGGLNHLYRVKTAIASGGTFTVGTNIVSIDIGTLNKQITASTGEVFSLQNLINGNY